uniref:CUB domain-containing protein n=1 Tax=Panagrellus redivivus TaxID=6233 RepID=A0A7E4W5N8_PANRE
MYSTTRPAVMYDADVHCRWSYIHDGDKIRALLRPLDTVFSVVWRSASAAIPSAKTAIRSACDWLCCTSSTRDNTSNWRSSRSSCYSVYEVADANVTANPGARSPNVAIKSGRKISPVPNIEQIVVIRQNKEKKKFRHKAETSLSNGTSVYTSNSKKNSCPASVCVIENGQKPSVASLRSFNPTRRLSEVIFNRPTISINDVDPVIDPDDTDDNVRNILVPAATLRLLLMSFAETTQFTTEAFGLSIAFTYVSRRIIPRVNYSCHWKFLSPSD